jgi:hypothetical protein
MSAGTMESAAADVVAAPLDLLLTDAALGALNRVNPGGSGLRLAAALAVRRSGASTTSCCPASAGPACRGYASCDRPR